MADQTQDRELKNALAQIEKQFGKGAIMQLGQDSAALDVPGISTGALSLDIALGGRGLPRGRIIEIFGPESSGKTTVALHAVASRRSKAAWRRSSTRNMPSIPAGPSGSASIWKVCSSASRRNGEEALKIAEMLIKSNAVDIIVIDSVAALVPRAEIEGEIGDPHVGLQARLMSQAMRILNPTIARTKTCMIFINQIRQKIGVMFGNPETTSGGLALKFYSSVRLDIRKVTAIKEGEETVGSRMRDPRGQEQGGPAVPAGRVRPHVRSRHQPRRRPASTWPSRTRSSTRAAPGSATAKCVWVRAARTPSSICATTRH